MKISKEGKKKVIEELSQISYFCNKSNDMTDSMARIMLITANIESIVEILTLFTAVLTEDD